MFTKTKQWKITNDVTGVFKSWCLLFADDLKLYSIIKDISDATNLQNDIANLQEWCLIWGIDLNITKCSMISCHNKCSFIKFDYKIDDLGVTFSRSLSFKPHIENILKKASQSIGFLKRMTSKFRSPNTILTLYKSLTRPLLENCSTIWSLYTKQDYILIKKNKIKKF